MAKSVLEGVQCIAGQSMGILDKLTEQGYQAEELIVAAEIEQVRAIYALATVMARIHEALTNINEANRVLPHG